MTTMICAGDAFCRCRTCKPPLPAAALQFDPERVDPRRLPSTRLVIGSTGLAIILMLCMILGQQ